MGMTRASRHRRLGALTVAAAAVVTALATAAPARAADAVAPTSGVTVIDADGDSRAARTART